VIVRICVSLPYSIESSGDLKPAFKLAEKIEIQAITLPSAVASIGNRSCKACASGVSATSITNRSNVATRNLLCSLAKLWANSGSGERKQWLFTQRQIREATGWSSFQVKKHLAKLAELEYVLIHRGTRGYSFTYELLYQGEGPDGKPFLQGLIDVDKLKSDTDREHSEPDREPPGSTEGAPREQGGSTRYYELQPNDEAVLNQTNVAWPK